MYGPARLTQLFVLLLSGCGTAPPDAGPSEEAAVPPSDQSSAEAPVRPPEDAPAIEGDPQVIENGNAPTEEASATPPTPEETLGAERSGGTTVKARLSRRLSPQARKLVLRQSREESVRALVQVAPTADLEALRAELEGHGAKVSSWMEETRLLTIEVDVGHLAEVAELPGVTYVDVATAYRR